MTGKSSISERLIRIGFLAIFLLCGCATIDYTRYECGKIWGAERFVKEGAFHEKYLIASRKGYLYAIAGALILQKDDREGRDHFFAPIPRLRQMKNHYKTDGETGFEAAVFEVRADETAQFPHEVVIAFAGSNDPKDWIQNFSPLDTRQYRQAVEYTKEIKRLPAYRSLPLKVAGYSLGGALAVHVAKNPQTSDLVCEAWALNPSPKTYASGKADDRIWLVAHRGEALAFLRTPLFRILPGVAAIGATEAHTVDDFYLIKTNLFYGHFRWVLPIEMLHAADFAILKSEGRSTGTTEPMEILRRAHFAGAKPCN